MKISSITNLRAKSVQNTNFNQNKKYNFIAKPISFDYVSFSGNIETHKINVDTDTANFIANSLSSSTAGHRAVYNSKVFNKDVVELLTAGVGEYAKTIKNEKEKPLILIGGDTREATRDSLPLINDTLIKQGADVIYIKDSVPSPLLALAAKENNVDIAILMTASHNPWEDGGFNLVTKDAAIAPATITKKVANHIIDIAQNGYYTSKKSNQGTSIEFYPYQIYKDKINSLNLIDWQAIKNSDISIYYDGLKGTGLNIFPRLLDEYQIPYRLIDAETKEGPNPTKENLSELIESVKNETQKLKIGLANDGDADRFGVIDEKGNFITTDDVVLLVMHHLIDNKHLRGDIIRNQSTSSQLDLFAQNSGLNVIQTPVGFKYIGEKIMDIRNQGSDILIAGESSGGLTIQGHVPEKDGILALLLILDMIACENKPLSQILDETKKSTGVEYRVQSFDKKLNENKDKEIIMQRMRDIYQKALNGEVKFGNFKIDAKKTREVDETIRSYKQDGDGVKLYLTDGSSVLVRKSGTEPKVRAFIETYNQNAQIADENIDNLSKEVEKIFRL